VKADRLRAPISRETERSRKLYSSRGAVERELGRLKHEWALLSLRVRGLDRVRLRADLTILAQARLYARRGPGSAARGLAADRCSTQPVRVRLLERGARGGCSEPNGVAMKRVKRVLLVLVATLLAMAAITTSALASSSDFYLNLGGIQGEGTTHVVRTPSGQIRVNEIPATGPCNSGRNPNCVVIT
jgi:hypothetical protein